MQYKLARFAALGSVVSVALLSIGAPHAYAVSPAERLMSAIASSSLDTPGLQPWHLKLDVTVYDDAGKNPITGTIERWQTDDATKTVFTFGGATVTRLHSSGKSYEMHSGPFIPALAEAVLEETVHPGPNETELQHADAEMRRQIFGQVKFDCIMLMSALKNNPTVPLGLFPTYCITEQNDRLRISFNFGSFTVIRNGIGTFQGRDVATALTLKQQQVTLAEANITTLQSFTPSPDQFIPDAAMQTADSGAAHLSGKIVTGQLISKMAPIYPASARANHVSGTVVLHAIISEDGHIRSLRPETTPDVDLTISALDAVRHWTYKPYIFNGIPCEVDTTITVNYNLNPF